ncbi:hypothetical protein [Clostridium sp. AM42-4]|jgi:hypothetical protein|uniref:hypothetical protein n=1 Tax=Clostridium sp. AM42-4 TaxID=2292305 RepID=UPI000E4776F5|nr:hypothetical protein [Clostridium sp. AM42-4]RHS87841.1 hypothetical protein DW922_07560 [Clostridium sp. AM42-4]
MKKHNMMRVASALAVVTLLSTSVISGTLAKYTSTASSTATATVAKWSFKVGAGGTNVTATNDITGTNPFTFDLFGSIKDTGGTEKETDVTDVTGKHIIAPGTSGQITLALENDSQVNAGYTIKFIENNKDEIPLQYAIMDGTGAEYSKLTWTKKIGDLNKTVASLGTGSENNKASYTVYWKWDYTDSTGATRDSSDTTLGVGAQKDAATATITATVTATQVD